MSYNLINNSEIQPGAVLDQGLLAKIKGNFDIIGASSISLGAGTSIDWGLGNLFTKTAETSSVTFSFTGQKDGKVISLIVKNESGVASSVNFPGVFKPVGDLSIEIGKRNIYTFLCAEGDIYLSSIKNMSV